MPAMKINNIPTRSIRPVNDAAADADTDTASATAAVNFAVDIIDQTALPHALRWLRLHTVSEAAHAIRSMQVRGAPLIGVTAAYGLALAMRERADDQALNQAIKTLAATRPTAVNLAWALARMQKLLAPLRTAERDEIAWEEAGKIAEEDVRACQAIGQNGLPVLRALAEHSARLELMTHCNAGWLATVDYGTALAPIYAAFDAGIDVHVWVSETRPRNQGLLTAWELAQHGVPHTLIADNAAGVLLAQGKVDAVIVGADRIAANGDVANKVGTYLKALAAREAGVPFYVAAPRSTIDFACMRGAAIPIEERDGDEIRLLTGIDGAGQCGTLRQLPATEAIGNPAFDVTPARLVTAIVTEAGVCSANLRGLQGNYADLDRS